MDLTQRMTRLASESDICLLPGTNATAYFHVIRAAEASADQTTPEVKSRATSPHHKHVLPPTCERRHRAQPQDKLQ